MIASNRRRIKLKTALRILALLFVLTGCAGLLAEQCFEKLLTGLVGASTPAAAIVLSVYFLGLTLGSLLYGRRLAVRWHPLKAYAVIEAGVAAWSILLALGTGPGMTWFVPLLKLGLGDLWSLQAMRFLVACIWILPPTLLMGASFPVIVSALERMRVPQPRRAMSRFYTLNLLGAILGAVLGPYLFFPLSGLTGTLLLTFCADGVAAAIALGLAARISYRHVAEAEPPALHREASATSRMSLLLWVGLFSGFLFFGLEVLWTHLIGAVLGNSVYAFAAMLTLVLAGLGAGGMLSTRVFREDRPVSAVAIGLMLLFGSLLLAWQYSLWPDVPDQLILWGGNMTTFAEGEMLRWFEASRLLLPPAVVFGMVYPALYRMERFPLYQRARHAAHLGAMNFLGCITGALLTGFFLIPELGSEATLILFGCLALFTGLLLVVRYGTGWRRWALALSGVLLALLWARQPPWNRLSLTSGGHVYFQPAFVDANSQLLFYHEDTLGGITTVVSNSGHSSMPAEPAADDEESPRANDSVKGLSQPGISRATRTLLTNGKFQANDGDEVRAQTGFAMVPILHVSHLDSALVIGLGSGHSAGIVKRMGFNHVGIAEIAPGIVNAADGYFSHINGNLLHQPGVSLNLEDGRNHLLLTDRNYDLITMEFSSVWYAGSTSLYCREFYELTRRHLNPGGIMQQWIQLHHISMNELGSVIATMRQVYPNVTFWVVGGQGILVASMEPLQIQPGAVEKMFLLNPWNDPSPEAVANRFVALLSCRLLSSDDVDRLLTMVHFRINTDANRFLEYATPRYNLSRKPLQTLNMRSMALFASFPRPEAAAGQPAAVTGLIDQVTPALQRKILGLPESPPVSAP